MLLLQLLQLLLVVAVLGSLLCMHAINDRDGCVHAILLLLVHVEVGVGVLEVTHMGVRAFLEVAVGSIGMRSTCPDAVLTLEAPHRKIVWNFAQARVRGAFLAVGAQKQARRLQMVVVGMVWALQNDI